MIPLLFLNPRWARENPVAAVLVGVIFIGLSLALMDWWRAGITSKANDSKQVRGCCEFWH